MADYQDCPSYLQEFLFYMLTIRGRSPRTVDAYHVDLRAFLRYIKSAKLLRQPSPAPEDLQQLAIHDLPLQTISEITLADVYGFLTYMLEQCGNNAKTRARKVSALRSFFNYLTKKANLLRTNPVENLEVPALKKSVPRYLTLEESLELLNDTTPASSASYERDFCILTLFLNCGMRLSELVGINLTDIRDDTVRLLGKGNKERIVYLNAACQKALASYLAVRKPPVKTASKDALFLSSRGNRISPRRVEQILEEWLKRAGLAGRGYSPHKLRHTAATLLYQYGEVDIRVLKEILGHVSLSTTEIYTHVSDRQMENAASRSPLSSVSPSARKRVPSVKTDPSETGSEQEPPEFHADPGIQKGDGQTEHRK